MLVSQARPLLALECVQGAGQASRQAVLVHLANFAGLGSIADLILGPLFGRLSDQYGRKPFYMLFLTTPPLLKLLVILTPSSSPKLKLWTIYLEFLLSQCVGGRNTLTV